MSAALNTWLQAARRQAQQPPAQPRLPFFVAGHAVGSVAAGFWEENGLWRALHGRLQRSEDDRDGAPCWQLDVPAEGVSDALNALASALRERGLCGPWRDEQLAVCNAAGERLGTVERGAVRVLGIATQAVHLVGLAPDGRMWVQKRSLTKPNDPGRWDTLMGGMISAADSLPQALARETWEEAGLRVAELQQVGHGGHVLFCRPSSEGGGTGYMVERIDWFRATVPEGMAPANQDGEVDEFALRSTEELQAQLAQDRFTLEAGLVMAAHWGL
ncbi:DUF4743 domain-containing protein [Paracidovorax wautersii]|uniref:NUDIX hydrolase n=1 Tax=Paracidovorax wautersii TaxID=1177982 RepID=UPI0031DDD3FD